MHRSIHEPPELLKQGWDFEPIDWMKVGRIEEVRIVYTGDEDECIRDLPEMMPPNCT